MRSEKSHAANACQPYSTSETRARKIALAAVTFSVLVDVEPENSEASSSSACGAMPATSPATAAGQRQSAPGR